MFHGKKCPRHEKRLSKLVSELFAAATERGRLFCGILLNEVGNLSELVGQQGREKCNRVLTASFRQSCSEEPQLYWISGETMVAFRLRANVESRPTLKD